MPYFLNERHHGTRNLQRDLLLGHLQPGVGKNSKNLAIWILVFDDVTVKPIYRNWILNGRANHNKVLASFLRYNDQT